MAPIIEASTTPAEPRGAPGTTPSSSSIRSASDSAASWRSTRCRCRSAAVRSSASSGRTAPARRPCSTSSAASSTRARGTIRYRGTRPAQAPSPRPGQARHRAHPPGRRAVRRADRARERDARAPSRRCAATSASSFLGLWRSSREERRVAARAMEVLDELGAADYARRLPSALPYAIQKRTALARALMAEPRLLLLDEPASGLSESEMDALGSRIRGPDRAHVRAPRRAPHGPRHVGVRPHRRPQLRTGDRQRHPRRHPRQPRRGDRLPRGRGARPAQPPSARGTTVLEVRDLSVSFGAVQALRSVSFDAEPGAITAVLGANGAGKTTLLRTISGLVKPRDGVGALRRGPAARAHAWSPSRAWASPTCPRVAA